MASKLDKSQKDLVSDLISQAEAARLRGVTRAAIRDLIRRGRIRSVSIGGRDLVYKSEVEAFEREKPGPKSAGDQDV